MQLVVVWCGDKMKKGILAISFILCSALGLTACSTGEYNDFECDPADYQAQCLGPNSYMYCKAGQLISVVCGGKRVCNADGNTVACKDPVEPVHESSIIKE